MQEVLEAGAEGEIRWKPFIAVRRCCSRTSLHVLCLRPIMIIR
jgi:hypothetical protein